MKILRLRFRNLNSLAGDWDIDFTHPDFVSSGIFAITGPTGAGKSTILDAICLSLYGQTPRLGRITQSANEIMSRQTGDCSAEVEFETAKGCFRCHWSQHRSRRQADGKLQSPRHEIAEAQSGAILESTLTAVVKKVEDVTGMDFDRFTRSMLLAQGGFAAFLQASPNERAPILEQITGTEIYSRISMKVHECASEERRRLEALRADLNGLQLLSPAEVDSLGRELTERQQEETALAAAAGQVREAQTWLERLAALEVELVQLDQAWHSFMDRKEAAAPQLERLALAGRALVLGADYALLTGVRRQQQEEQEQLLLAHERLPLLQQGWQASFEALERAETELGRARVLQTDGAELIRRTRELDVRIGESRSQLSGLSSQIEMQRRQSGEYRLAMARCDKQLAELGTQLGAVELFLAEHGADAALVQALTGIEQQVRALKALDRQWRDDQEKLVRQVALIDGARLALNKAEAAWQEAGQAVAGAEQRLAQVRAAREALLQGRELSAWRKEAETIATREGRLLLLQETVARIGEVRQGLAELNQRRDDLEQKRQALLKEDETLAGEWKLREEVARQLRERVVLLNRVRDLEAERLQLIDGVPCPLCGATEHPYAAGNVPQLDDVQRELAQALSETERVRELLSANRSAQVAVSKDLDQARQDYLDRQGRQERDEGFCMAELADLGLQVDREEWASVIRQESASCRESLVRLRGAIIEAEQKEQEERGAQAALDRVRDELAGHDKARLAADLSHKGALNELERLERAAAAIQADLERMLAEVDGAVEGYGFRDVVADNADGMVAALTARRDAFGQRLLAKERLVNEIARTGAEGRTQQALLTEAEKNLAENEQQLRDRTAQLHALVEQRLELYGERSPDQEEKRLADGVRLADECRDGALREQNRLRGELDGLNQQILRLTAAITEREKELGQLETTLGARLAEAGFVDEGAFQQASLPPERFAELTQLAERLRQEETTLLARQQDRRDALASERERGLTESSLEGIREENATLTIQLSELQKTLGALAQRLSHHAEQQERHEVRLRAIERQMLECGRWERLHELIGSADGKKFRNFAQGLTFELMVAHANRQLLKMSDRYILVRDLAEPLELNVIDNYQAGEIRSTKNLSGGESFIVSLALALGLSGMASRNVRVDSLFLDEGFGTLDEDALETALETLSGLQQEGKLIGIISHVSALKERIGTQIQVESGSGGRSSLSGPGCRQIV